MKAPGRNFLSTLADMLVGGSVRSQASSSPLSIIDALDREPPTATIGTNWQLFTDSVMGGVSKATMARETVDRREAIRLLGDVSVKNNGGFVQICLDFRPDGLQIDASSWRGVEVDVFGNGEEYGVSLRTTDLTRPWQSYRQSFLAAPNWTTVKLPFKYFVPNRTDAPLDIRLLQRIGIIGIGTEFSADISLGGVRFFQ